VGQLAVTRVSPALGRLDTMVMFGNNCGIFGSRRRRPWLLRRFKSITRPGAKILAAGTDPYTTDNPEHLAHHEQNRRRGRMETNSGSASATATTRRRGSTTCSRRPMSLPSSPKAPAGS
jgi:hypothetical protein